MEMNQPRRSRTLVINRSIWNCWPTATERHDWIVPREAAVLPVGSASRPTVVVMGVGVGVGVGVGDGGGVGDGLGVGDGGGGVGVGVAVGVAGVGLGLGPGQASPTAIGAARAGSSTMES